MPRIQASTVAEQRAMRHRALLDAARSVIAETGKPPSMGEVGRRAGLTRSGVYQYFGSVDELLTAVVADVFPDWYAEIERRVAAAPTAGERVWAYIEGNFASFVDPKLAVARMLAQVVAPQDLRAPMREFHRHLQMLLQQALIDLHEPEVELMAEFIDSLILRATHAPEMDGGSTDTGSNERALRTLRRLLGPYLGLDVETEAGT